MARSGLIGRVGRRALLLVFVLSASLVSAGSVYRHQDEDGQWHYSDERPDGVDEIEEIAIDPGANPAAAVSEASDTDVHIPDSLCKADLARRSSYYRARGGYLGKAGGFKLINRGSEDAPELYARNDYFSPVSVRVWFTQRAGVVAEPELPLVLTIASHSQHKVASIKPTGGAWNFRYRWTYQLGENNAAHDRGCYYLPPVPAGAPYYISQAFNGPFSHNDRYNRYAIDIAMPEGTPIVAARDGIVVGRKTDFVLSGLDSYYLPRANSLWIMHGDGTFSVYAHLQFRTIKVYEGERVRAGQLIARSGNTGYSTGPHLHFSVVANRNQHWYSLPFKLHTGANAITPQQGMVLVNRGNDYTEQAGAEAAPR